MALSASSSLRSPRFLLFRASTTRALMSAKFSAASAFSTAAWPSFLAFFLAAAAPPLGRRALRSARSFSRASSAACSWRRRSACCFCSAKFCSRRCSLASASAYMVGLVSSGRSFSPA